MQGQLEGQGNWKDGDQDGGPGVQHNQEYEGWTDHSQGSGCQRQVFYLNLSFHSDLNTYHFGLSLSYYSKIPTEYSKT